MISRLPIPHCLLAALAGALIVSSGARARADAADGTSFVREVGREVLAAPGGERTGAPPRDERLRAIYRARFDTEGIAARVAGRAWREAPPARRMAFAELLERYIAKSMDARLAQFAGADIEVLMSEPEADGLIVYSRVVQRERARSFNVHWRLAKDGGSFRVRDVVVENMSITLHLRRRLRQRSSVHARPLDAMIVGLDALIAAGD